MDTSDKDFRYCACCTEATMPPLRGFSYEKLPRGLCRLTLCCRQGKGGTAAQKENSRSHEQTGGMQCRGQGRTW